MYDKEKKKKKIPIHVTVVAATKLELVESTNSIIHKTGRESTRNHPPREASWPQ